MEVDKFDCRNSGMCMMIRIRSAFRNAGRGVACLADRCVVVSN